MNCQTIRGGVEFTNFNVNEYVTQEEGVIEITIPKDVIVMYGYVCCPSNSDLKCKIMCEGQSSKIISSTYRGFSFFVGPGFIEIHSSLRVDNAGVWQDYKGDGNIRPPEKDISIQTTLEPLAPAGTVVKTYALIN